MKNRYYNYISNFVFRTPFFPIEFLNNTDLQYDNSFKEGIYLASPDLYKLIYDNPQATSNNDCKINNTLYKYLSRCCTRCTPFGLFAGCSVGQIGNKTDIYLPPYKLYQRVTRLDMIFICSLITKIEKDKNVNRKLLYYPNDSMYLIADKLRYIEYKYIDSRISHTVASVIIDEYILKVIKRAQTGATIIELVECIIEEEITFDDAVEFIQELIEAQILTSELAPSIVGDDIFNSLIEKLTKIEDEFYLPILLKIQKLLFKIDSTIIGNSIDIYKKIITEIENLEVNFNPKYLFQTDLYKPNINAIISEDIVNDITDYLVLAHSVSKKIVYSNIENFKNAFVSRYGEQEMPLNIVLDKELGLGYPYVETGVNDINPLIDKITIPLSQNSDTIQLNYNNFDSILLIKYTQAIKEQTNEVVLNDDDFNIKNNKSDIKKFVDTATIVCSVLQDNTSGRSIYIKSISSVNSISLLGRFCHINSDIHNLAKDIISIEDHLNNEGINAEISHLPEFRIGNIASRPAFRDIIIHYFSNGHNNEKNSIYTSDLTLKVENNKIILRSRSLNKVINPKLSCAHNFSNSSIPIYRFLCDIQAQNMKINLNLGWNNFMQSLDYLPRIRYKNIIIARQRWNIKKNEIELAYKLKPNKEILSFFSNFKRNKKMPNSLIIPEFDNELLVQFDNINSILNFLTHVKNKAGFILEEFLFDKDDNVVIENKYHFTNEMIFTLYKNAL